MKKFFSLLGVFVFGALVLTGCGSSGEKLTCTVEQKDEASGQTMKAEIIAKLKEDKIDSVSAEMTFDSEDAANQYYSILQLAEAFMEEGKSLDLSKSGKTIKIGNMMDMLSSEGNEEEGEAAFDVSKATKDEFKKYVEAQGYTCK